MWNVSCSLCPSCQCLRWSQRTNVTLWAVSSGKWSPCLSLIRGTRKSRNPSARIWSVSDVRWKRSSAQLRVVSYNHLTQFKTLKNLKKKIVFPVKCHYYFKTLEESFLQQNKLEFGMINWRLRIFATKQTCSQVRRGNRGNSVRIKVNMTWLDTKILKIIMTNRTS